MTDPGVTVSLPPCQPDHPWASIPTADLAHGRCPACGALLDGEMAARMIRARRLVRRIWEAPMTDRPRVYSATRVRHPNGGETSFAEPVTLIEWSRERTIPAMTAAIRASATVDSEAGT